MAQRVPIDRRQFLGYGIGAMAAAGLVSVAPAAARAEEAASAASSAPAGSFLIPPDPIGDDQITETFEADIVVVGAGLAGLCAARAAAEAGASVLVIEKAETYQYRSGGFAINGSSIQKELGMEFDATYNVMSMMKEMGYRTDQRLWNLWRDHSGECYDWLLEPVSDNYEVLTKDATSYDPDKVSIYTAHFPVETDFDQRAEFTPAFPQASLIFLPDMGNVLEPTYQKSVADGAEYHFATWARQLVRGDERVEAVIAQDIDGNYLRFNAKKAVILCAGEYGNNTEMVKYYCGGRTWPPLTFPNIDAKGDPTNTGEGLCMGAWIGAKVEDGPHAPMTHTLGGALGTDPYFMCNALGYRFCNEDVGGQQLSSQIYRQPGDYAWQIFDDTYPESIKSVNYAHGSVNKVVDDADLPRMEGAQLTLGRTSLTSREEIESFEGYPVPDGVGCLMADTLDELFEKMQLDDAAKTVLAAEIARYNELCEKGVDEDFGKDAVRMASITKPPFYASRVAAGVMLTCMGGLTVDPVSLNVVDADYKPIPGLYAAGNTMGGMFVQDCPVSNGGNTHGKALVTGKLAAEYAVANN